MLFLAQLKFC